MTAADGRDHALGALCMLLLAVPITGWAAASVRPWVVRAFGVLSLPQILPPGARIGFEIGDYHGGILVWTLLSVAVLHILAAITGSPCGTKC